MTTSEQPSQNNSNLSRQEEDAAARLTAEAAYWDAYNGIEPNDNSGAGADIIPTNIPEVPYERRADGSVSSTHTVSYPPYRFIAPLPSSLPESSLPESSELPSPRRTQSPLNELAVSSLMGALPHLRRQRDPQAIRELQEDMEDYRRYPTME